MSADLDCYLVEFCGEEVIINSAEVLQDFSCVVNFEDVMFEVLLPAMKPPLKRLLSAASGGNICK